MMIDFTAKILDLAGEPIRDGQRDASGTLIEETAKDLTLGNLAVNALLTPLVEPNGQPERLNGETHVRHATLAQAIFTTPKKVEMKVEDVATIKDRIARSYGSLAVMRAWQLLDPRDGA